ncbi:PAS/PAC sensor signal transduction histidine kinase [Solidesulfovibrio carbinoliphilus subsp. oakridgensis]|uniref:histidine kinase n=1 Tax=Solidesulfovibrio carbinoliphilus subsp. oakridgensis TaxID=694327 RepID=G7Q7B3_9BACT|nr:PAS domain S-box protein [Solidesulfovibrio carbinoliphilus]EHJ49070.1 PAS/PAC sensor signal transduction histidine kinase [Solidesulfovibrio carbinoliphilus subsp. oakridgensis]
MAKGLFSKAGILLLGFAAAGLLVVPAGWLVFRVENARFLEGRRATVQAHLGEVRLALEAALAARLACLHALAAFAASRPDAGDREFTVFAARLVAGEPDIRSVQLARDLTVSHVFPEAGNPGILGLSLPKALPPPQAAALAETLESGRMTLLGPVPLLQGGQGLIARMPVRLPAGPGGPDAPRLWGLATVILDSDAFFRDVEPGQIGAIRLAIRAGDDAGPGGALAYGDPAIFGDTPVVADMAVPGGSWRLAAIPAGGWAPLAVPWSLLGPAGATWLVLGLAFSVFLTWPARLARGIRLATAALDAAKGDLERTVEARTRELSAANESLRNLYEYAPVGIFTSGPEGRYRTVNHCLARMYGFDTPQELLAGVTDIQDQIYCDPGERTALLARLADCGQLSDYETRRRTRTGDAIWVSLNIRAVCDASGGIVRLEGFCTDITARKRADASLRLLWAAVEQSPASIVITDADGTIEYVNPHFTVLTGYTPEEARGQNPRLLKSGVHPPAFYAALWETLRSGRVWRGEFCNRTKEGGIYWEDSSISPVRDEAGRITHFVAVKEDITAQKERKDRLRRLMAEFEALFDASSVGIVHLGPDRRVVRVNRRFSELFGLASMEMAGRALEDIHGGSTRLRAFRQETLARIEAGESVHFEERLRSKAGHVFWCSIHGTRIEPDSPASGSLWIFDDISARRELEAVREDVERIMRHDLKAPLNSIVNLPELVAAVGPVTDEQREMLGEIERAGEVMLRQIELSLDLYKMETGTYVPQVQRIDLARIVAGVGAMLAKTASPKGVALALSAGDGPVFAMGSAVLCQNIAANLLKNAIEAEAAGATVAIRVFAEAGRTVLAIHNPSPVPADILPVFFEKYATSGKAGGSGLGTYSARLMAESQGGRISLESTPASGTTVTVSLPGA